jgi:hypothetical protein
MMLTHAIELARTEHVVHFLLASYVETLDYYDTTRALLPGEIRYLPLAGTADVHSRLSALRALLDTYQIGAQDDTRRAIEEAVDVFTVASRRLTALDTVVMSPVQRWTVTLGRGEPAPATR